MVITQENLPMAVHWQENQIVITFRAAAGSATRDEKNQPFSGLVHLNRLLASTGFALKPFSKADLPRSQKPSVVGASGVNSLKSPQGNYLFSLNGDKDASVVRFFHIETVPDDMDQPGMSDYSTPNIDGTGNTTATKDTTSNNYTDYYKNDHTVAVVNFINRNLKFINEEEVPIVSAMPNWLHGGARCTVNGGPAYPPLPVGSAVSSGSWKIKLPDQLPASLKNAKGAGVTVLVLDTLRPFADVSTLAASQIGQSNTLLQDIVNNVTFNYFDLSDGIDIPNPEQPVTGRDVYGRLIGYPMADHGLFVAGIIRDLAPEAHVECIRVLSDFGAGNMVGLIHVLEHIRDRLDHVEGAGVPLNLPLVINLSLVALPSDEEMQNPALGFNSETLQVLCDGLRMPMECLAERGVVFVAAAGNDSDPWSGSVVTLPDGTTAPKRFGPRYPAAFANAESLPGQPARPGISTMIPVGAINQAENAASYSNYPGSVGIATYGGEVPTPNPKDAPPLPPPALPYGTPTQIMDPIDAMRGIYTSALFPAPSMDDRLPPPSPQAPEYPEYLPTQPTTWAYWVGTSFATPIISALAARVLQDPTFTGDSVRQTLIAAATQKPLWTRLSAQSTEAVPGNMIMATQEYVSDGQP